MDEKRPYNRGGRPRKPRKEKTPKTPEEIEAQREKNRVKSRRHYWKSRNKLISNSDDI